MDGSSGCVSPPLQQSILSKTTQQLCSYSGRQSASIQRVQLSTLHLYTNVQRHLQNIHVHPWHVSLMYACIIIMSVGHRIGPFVNRLICFILSFIIRQRVLFPCSGCLYMNHQITQYLCPIYTQTMYTTTTFTCVTLQTLNSYLSQTNKKDKGRTYWQENSRIRQPCFHCIYFNQTKTSVQAQWCKYLHKNTLKETLGRSLATTNLNKSCQPCDKKCVFKKSALNIFHKFKTNWQNNNKCKI